MIDENTDWLDEVVMIENKEFDKGFSDGVKDLGADLFRHVESSGCVVLKITCLCASVFFAPVLFRACRSVSK